MLVFLFLTYFLVCLQFSLEFSFEKGDNKIRIKSNGITEYFDDIYRSVVNERKRT